MPILSEKTLFQLSKYLQDLQEKLEERAPDLVAEIALVERLIEAKMAGAEKTYASVSGPTEAITLCLSLAGNRKMTKKEIIREILNGGYMPDKPRAANGSLNDMMNQLIKKQKLVLKGEHVSLPPKKTPASK